MLRFSVHRGFSGVADDKVSLTTWLAVDCLAGVSWIALKVIRSSTMYVL